MKSDWGLGFKPILPGQRQTEVCSAIGLSILRFGRSLGPSFGRFPDKHASLPQSYLIFIFLDYFGHEYSSMIVEISKHVKRRETNLHHQYDRFIF